MRAVLTSEIAIRPMRTRADAEAFRRLNEAWITPLFGLEPADIATLEDPFGAIVARGGDVLLACDGDHPAGCVSLLPEGDGTYELSKMTVEAGLRGRGIGRRLIEAAIARARALGGTRLVLASNHRLAPAIALYESSGFRHVPPAPNRYARADVFMELPL
jgi:GNAT superfamily N-acetyltransferase